MCVLPTCICVSVQDPPNAELVCKVNGVATTTAVTITAPVLMTDETGAMTLTYDVELLRMARGGPTVFNTSALVEPVNDEELVCDEDSGVSLFIDNVAGGCPSPMTSSYPFIPPFPLEPGQQLCYAGFVETTPTCASGFEVELLQSAPPDGIPYCVPSN